MDSNFIFEMEVLASCKRDGYTSRRCGLKLDDCPPYKVETMAEAWREGWNEADKDIMR